MTLTDAQRAAIRSDESSTGSHFIQSPHNPNELVDFDRKTVRALMRLGEIVVSRLQNEEGYGLANVDADGLLEVLAAELERAR